MALQEATALLGRFKVCEADSMHREGTKPALKLRLAMAVPINRMLLGRRI